MFRFNLNYLGVATIKKLCWHWTRTNNDVHQIDYLVTETLKELTKIIKVVQNCSKSKKVERIKMYPTLYNILQIAIFLRVKLQLGLTRQRHENRLYIHTY